MLSTVVIDWSQSTHRNRHLSSTDWNWNLWSIDRGRHLRQNVWPIFITLHWRSTLVIETGYRPIMIYIYDWLIVVDICDQSIDFISFISQHNLLSHRHLKSIVIFNRMLNVFTITVACTKIQQIVFESPLTVHLLVTSTLHPTSRVHRSSSLVRSGISILAITLYVDHRTRLGRFLSQLWSP